MRLFVEVARSTFRRATTYRWATFAGVVTNTVFGFILAYVLLAVFAKRGTVGGFDATDAVTFTFVAQGLLMVVGVFGNVEMSERVRTGDVAVDLCRPYDFQSWWLAVHYGKAPFSSWWRRCSSRPPSWPPSPSSSVNHRPRTGHRRRECEDPP